MIDFNNVGTQIKYELIPEGTIARAKIFIKRDSSGSLVTSSKGNDKQYLNCIFTVLDNPYKGNKIYSYIGIEGDKNYVYRGAVRLRAILESAKGIMPNDDSYTAKSGRLMESYDDLEGLVVQVKVRIKKDPNGKYDDKNDIEKIITPDFKEYVSLSGSAKELKDYGIPF